MLRNNKGYIICLLFFSRFYKYGTILTKTGSYNYGRIHLFPLPVPVLYFSVNMKRGGINIKLRAERDGIFPVRFQTIGASPADTLSAVTDLPQRAAARRPVPSISGRSLPHRQSHGPGARMSRLAALGRRL